MMWAAEADDDGEANLAALDQLTASVQQGHLNAGVDCLDLMIHALQRESTTTMTSSMTSRGAGYVSQLTSRVSTACTGLEQQIQVCASIIVLY